ncbi:MAG: hypothetical protein ACTSVI_03515, partial [Promethearchaeota archaeon]
MHFMKGRMRAVKVAFIGPPNAGKTSLRKIFFEGVMPTEILSRTIKPTVGLRFKTYEYYYSYQEEKEHLEREMQSFPVKLALVDTSGQEIDNILDSSKDRIFYDLDILYLVFSAENLDLSGYMDHVKEIIRKINIISNKLNVKFETNILCHKIDMICENNEKNRNVDDLKSILE